MNQTKKYLVLCGIVLLLAMYMSPLVVSTVATDGVDEELENLNERDITITNEGNNYTINSRLSLGATQDEFDLTMMPEGSGLQLKMEYNTEANNPVIELSFTVIFYSIIEYVDMNGDGIYIPENDTFVKEVPISEPFNFKLTNQTTANNKTIYLLNATMANGLFSCLIYVVENFVLLNGTWILPTEMKIDIAIHNFNYSSLVSDLALKFKLDSSSEYNREYNTADEAEGYGSNEEAVETNVNGFSGFFSWTNTALIDGIEKAVNVTPLSSFGGDEQTFYLNYPRGVNIIHDPKIGIEGILKMPADYTIFIVVGIIAVVAVVLAIFFIRRGKNA